MGGSSKQKAALAAAPDAMKRPAACQKASHQSATMIIVRFMEISLGHARMQVNTWRRGNDDQGAGTAIY